METINLTPTWEAAVRVYMMVLETPSAEESAKAGAREEIIRLARCVDRYKEQGEDND